jgi:hypothetical protein
MPEASLVGISSSLSPPIPTPLNRAGASKDSGLLSPLVVKTKVHRLSTRPRLRPVICARVVSGSFITGSPARRSTANSWLCTLRKGRSSRNRHHDRHKHGRRQQQKYAPHSATSFRSRRSVAPLAPFVLSAHLGDEVLSLYLFPYCYYYYLKRKKTQYYGREKLKKTDSSKSCPVASIHRVA